MFELDIVLLKGLFYLLVLILVDVVLGIALSIKNREFDLEKLPNFLKTEVLPYYLGISAITGLAMIEDLHGLGTEAIAWAVIATYSTKVVFVEIRKKLQRLFGFDV